MEKENNDKRIELSNQKRIRTLGKKKKYRYLKILEADTIKQVEMEKKKKKKKKDLPWTNKEPP